MAHFSSFAPFLEHSDFSDLVIECDAQEPGEPPTKYHVHKLILAANSSFFSQLLASKWKENIGGTVHLGFPDPDCVFPAVLRFLYTGRVTITKENAIPLLAMADHYAIPPLTKVTSQYISDISNRDNAFEILIQALRYSASEVIDTCVSVVARNFWRQHDEQQFCKLPFDILCRILDHRFLAIKEEKGLYNVVSAYVETKGDALNQEQRIKLFSFVRFRWLSFEELVQAQSQPHVPKDLLASALLLRLGKHETGSKGDSMNLDMSSEISLQPRKSFGVMFDFNANEEARMRGILFHIATAKGAEEWRNPHYTKRVKVSSSMLEKGDTRNLTNTTPTELWTKDVPASWFMVDLGAGRSVIVTTYSLRHGGNYRGDSLRNWDFQGSIDSREWTVIKRHTDDTSLDGPYHVRSWPIEGSTVAYRFFRILQTGHNSNNHNYLVLSGIELYGELYETESVSYD